MRFEWYSIKERHHRLFMFVLAVVFFVHIDFPVEKPDSSLAVWLN